MIDDKGAAAMLIMLITNARIKYISMDRNNVNNSTLDGLGKLLSRRRRAH